MSARRRAIASSGSPEGSVSGPAQTAPPARSASANFHFRAPPIALKEGLPYLCKLPDQQLADKNFRHLMGDYFSKYSAFVGALSAIVAVIYPFHYGPREIRKHNRIIRYLLFKIRQLDVISLIHKHIDNVNYIFNWIYGHPKDFLFRSYFTSRSLRVSVSLVVIYIILFPYLSAVVYASFTSQDQRISSYFFLIYTLFNYIVLIYAIRKFGLEEVGIRANLSHFLKIALSQFSLSSYIFTIYFLYSTIFNRTNYFNSPQDSPMLFLLLFNMYVISIVYIYVRFMHISILVVAAYTILIPLLFLLSYHIKRYFFTIGIQIISKDISIDSVVIFLASLIIYHQSLMTLAHIIRGNYKAIIIYLSFLWIATYIVNSQIINSAILDLYIYSRIFTINDLPNITDYDHYIVSFIILYWIFFGSILLIVYSNCYTDQLSVAFSRYIFKKISFNFSFSEIIYWFLIDFLLAIFVLALTMT